MLMSPACRCERKHAPERTHRLMDGYRYLATDDYKRDTHEWAQAKGLNIFHLRIDSCLDLDGEDAVAAALESILGTPTAFCLHPGY